MKSQPFAFESLETRTLCSAAPAISDIQFSETFLTLDRPVQFSALATDDVGVRAVTFFLDRNENLRWDAGVDQSLGDDFVMDSNGRYSVTVTPDATWPGYPWANIVADAVDTEGQWATTRAFRSSSFNGVPAVSSAWASITIYSEGQQNPYQSVTMYARVGEPFVYAFGAVNATFFLDKNFNGSWDTGVDVDLGVGGAPDGRGYVSKNTTIMGTTLGGQICTAPFYSISVPVSERFGEAVVVSVLTTTTPPAIISTVYTNLSDNNRDGVLVGQQVRISVVADAPLDYLYQNRLRAVTLFYDANADQLWTPGTDTHISDYFFGSDTLRGVTSLQFTVTSNMGTGYQPFVFAAVDRQNWGPTYTTWVKLVEPPLTDGFAPTSQAFSHDGAVTVDFFAHDDYATRSIFVWLDKNDNGLFDAGEGYQQSATRLQGIGTTSRWRAQINLSLLNYTPGTYNLLTIADDYQNARSAASVGTIITLV